MRTFKEDENPLPLVLSPCPLPKTKQIHQAAFLQTASVCSGATRHHSKHMHGSLELVYYDVSGYHKVSQLPSPFCLLFNSLR